MKRRLLSIFLAVAMLLLALPPIDLTAAEYGSIWSGSGTEKDPYLISTKEDLWELSRVSNSGENLTGVYFRQTNDIDLEDVVERNAPVTAKGQIDPKTVKLEWRGFNGLVYNGAPANVNALVRELIPIDEGNVTVAAVVGGDETNAGEKYIAEAKEMSGSNYALPTDGTEKQEYKIDPAPLYIHDKTVDYDGKTV